MNQGLKNKSLFHFWHWFAQKGLIQFADRWLILHIAIGYLIQHYLKMTLYELAGKLIIPFAAILVAIVFAWSGNISTVLLTSEMDEIRRKDFDAYINYVFNFQLATLINLGLIIIWFFISLDPFKGLIVKNSMYVSGRVLVFAFTSIAIRECWTMILRLQLHLIQSAVIRDRKQKFKLSLKRILTRKIQMCSSDASKKASKTRRS